MTSPSKNKQPEPWNLLYKNLFVRRDRVSALSVISEGLSCFAENASSLLDEAKILADAQKKARAIFLVTTANEEIAKSYILLDTCRLDFTSHEAPLKKLCQAFYGHIEKYAYNKTIRFSPIFRDSQNIPWHNISAIFKDALVRWWPSGDIESGEPDMPHNTYWERETNLYVDFSDYAQSWIVPIPENPRYEFGEPTGDDPYSKSRVALNRLLYTRDEKLYNADALDILNEVFRKFFINEKTNEEQIIRLYTAVMAKLEEKLGISAKKCKKSALMEWPLYHFLQVKHNSNR